MSVAEAYRRLALVALLGGSALFVIMLVLAIATDVTWLAPVIALAGWLISSLLLGYRALAAIDREDTTS
jgi:hypothetical protein